MGREKNIMLPSVQRLLSELGENIRFARLRRKFSSTVVAERAGIARNTLRAIERGDPNVSFGAYANVLLSLGLEKDLKLIAHDDELGRKLQDAGLPLKARAPRIPRNLIKKKERT
jgi:transcriptional regulator with XRE-family HTH domain